MNRLLDRIVYHWNQAGAIPLLEELQSLHGGNGTLTGIELLPFIELPGLCCAAAGGVPRQTDEITAAWGILYLSAHWLDSVADGDAPESEYGPRLTLASAAFATADLVLDDLENNGIQPEIAKAIRRDFHLTVLRTSSGQMSDLRFKRPSLEESWRIAEAKTGMIYGLACRSGARLATNDFQRLEKWGQFGLQLGVLIQISDDLHELQIQNEGDLARAKWNLTVAYAMSTASQTQRSYYSRLLQTARTDLSARQEIRTWLIQSGAMLYLVTEAERRFKRAHAALVEAAQSVDVRDKLLALLDLAVPLRST